MRRTLFVALAAVLILSLAACGQAGPGAVIPAGELAYAAAGDEASGMTELLPGDELYEQYVTEFYGLEPGSVLDGAVLAAGGASAREAAVFRFEAGDEALSASGALEAYVEARRAAFTGYMPAEEALLDAAVVETRGAYCVMLILPDAQGALARLDEYLEAPSPGLQPSPGASATPEPAPEPTPVPASEPWVYDAQRIKDAYYTGDSSALTQEELAILDEVRHILTSVAPESLGEYERELAIHDYIIEAADYDSSRYSLLPGFEPDPNNTNPYGALISGRAVCTGYTSAFQLLMDLAGLECITVHGEANLTREAHAWNMVRLDGEWYCVDVTWDDPSGVIAVSGSLAHRYFNVTSEYMRNTNHFWDEEAVPEATATVWAWQG